MGADCILSLGQVVSYVEETVTTAVKSAEQLAGEAKSALKSSFKTKTLKTKVSCGTKKVSNAMSDLLDSTKAATKLSDAWTIVDLGTKTVSVLGKAIIDKSKGVSQDQINKDAALGIYSAIGDVAIGAAGGAATGAAILALAPAAAPALVVLGVIGGGYIVSKVAEKYIAPIEIEGKTVGERTEEMVLTPSKDPYTGVNPNNWNN